MTLRVNTSQATDPQCPLGPSPSIWCTCPVSELLVPTSNIGWFKREDWSNGDFAAMTTVTPYKGYNCILDAGATIIPLQSAVRGTPATNGILAQLSMTLDATHDDTVGLQYWGPFVTSGSPLLVMKQHGTPMWFETIFRTETVVTGTNGLLIGLKDETVLAEGAIADGGAGIVSNDFVGFVVWADDGDSVDAIYQTAAGTPQTAKADCATITATTDATSLALSGWHRYGITFDGIRTATYYVDGVVVATADILASGFPDGEEMSPVWVAKDNLGEAQVKAIGWWQAAQLY